MVADEVEAGRRDQGGEPLQELEGLEDDVGRSVAPAVLEAVEEAPVLHAREPLGRDGRPCHVAAQPLQPEAVTRGDGDVRVKAHASHGRAALPLDEGEIVGIDAIAEPQDALPGARSHRDATGERGGERCEQRLLVVERISLRGIDVGSEPPALEKPGEASCHAAGDVRDRRDAATVALRSRISSKWFGARLAFRGSATRS